MRIHAREDDLIVREVGDELVAYDRKRHRVHRLNRTAALVWRWSRKGEISIDELSRRLEGELEVESGEDLARLAVDRLARARLLDAPAVMPAGAITRRQAIRRLGLAGAAGVLLPVVTSILAPSPADAATAPACAGSGDACTQDSDCCPGLLCDTAVTMTCFP